MSNLGKFITENRNKKNFSKRKLAKLADLSPTEIHRLENGERKNPSPLVLKNIAMALEINYYEIMKVSGYMDNIPNSQVILSRIPGIEDLTEQEIDEVCIFVDFLRNKRKLYSN